jgi:hypothetical protein
MVNFCRKKFFLSKQKKWRENLKNGGKSFSNIDCHGKKHKTFYSRKKKKPTVVSHVCYIDLIKQAGSPTTVRCLSAPAQTP